MLNWREFGKLDEAQKINTLAMIAPITNEEKQKLYNAIMDVIDEFERYWAYDMLRTIEEAEQFLEETKEIKETPYILADTKVPYLKICRPEQNSK